MKDVDSRVFTRMLRKDGQQRYYMYIPSQLRWRGDKNTTQRVGLVQSGPHYHRIENELVLTMI